MARMRSPNFPGLSLEESIKAAKIIWDKNRRAPISREAGAKDLGYTGLTGRSLRVLGAMNQYDLVENTSKGQMRVTKTAEDIFHGFPEDVRLTALRKAGRAPTLYQAIYDRFEGTVPGENAVRSFLFQSGFTNEGVEKALKNFLETNRYLEIAGASESYGDAHPKAPESAPEVEPDEEAPPKMEVAAAPAEARRGVRIFEPGPLDFNLSSSGLRVTGQTSSAGELRAFIEKLTALAALLPSKPAPNSPEDIEDVMS